VVRHVVTGAATAGFHRAPGY